MKIAVVCPYFSGHHQKSLRLYTKTLLELGCEVTAFAPRAGDLSSWVAAASPDLARNLRAIELHYRGREPVPGRLLVVWEKFAWVRFVAGLIREAGIKPDLVFHTWLDDCLAPGLTAGLTDRVFPYKWSGLYLHPWYLRQKQRYAWLRRGPLASHNALRSQNCPGVAVLDEGIADSLSFHVRGKPVIVFPDVADPAAPDAGFAPVVEIREKARGRKIVGLIGGLAKRKGMLSLLEVAQRSIQENWFFVFAGRWLPNSFAPEEQRKIEEIARSNPPNCYFYFQRIPDEAQFNALIEACDVLFAVYENFLSSSNLLTKAALFRKPILVNDSFCMGERVHQYGIGSAIPEKDPSACIRELHRLSDPGEMTALLQSARFDAYVKTHSLERLHASFARLLQEAG